MLNSRSRANSNGSLLVFSVGGHRKIRDHRGILTGYGLTQVGLESPSCIEDGCPCTKVSHQEVPVQESQSPNANRISGAESDQGWLSLQTEQPSLSAEESRLEVRHPSQDVWCTTKESFNNWSQSPDRCKTKTLVTIFQQHGARIKPHSPCRNGGTSTVVNFISRRGNKQLDATNEGQWN